MSTAETQKVFDHHIAALAAGDVEAIMEDYDDDAVMMTNIAGVIVGKVSIRELFANVKVTGFAQTELHVEGDYALVIWKSDQVRLGADTFVVRDGKIVLQTAAVELA
jgi:ketosteroid isomerase-like protein